MLAPATNQLLKQFHNNQSVWVARLATARMDPQSTDARLFQAGETVAMLPGASGVIMLPFEGAITGIQADHDRALAWMRHLRAHDVLMWGMVPNAAIDLAMIAQGYRVGFEPWWMTRDLDLPIAAPDHNITLANDRDVNGIIGSDLPYIMRDQLESTRTLVANGHREVIWLMARLDGRIVGQAIVNIAGDHAGLFNVGVSGRYRQRGIGTSLSLAAMHAAKDRGARTMNLNSTPMGMRIYERAGFRRIGVGQTWIRSGPEVNIAPDGPTHRMTIALGSGDLDTLRGRRIPAKLPNGMTAQELAARFNRQDTLYHLIETGHVPEIMSLWDVGLKTEAMAAAANPLARELVAGSRGARPIHLAVERGAGSLVIALIEAGADLTARDGEYLATPLDWAHACNKPTIARILFRAGGR